MPFTEKRKPFGEDLFVVLKHDAVPEKSAFMYRVEDLEDVASVVDRGCFVANLNTDLEQRCRSPAMGLEVIAYWIDDFHGLRVAEDTSVYLAPEFRWKSEQW